MSYHSKTTRTFIPGMYFPGKVESVRQNAVDILQLGTYKKTNSLAGFIALFSKLYAF